MTPEESLKQQNKLLATFGLTIILGLVPVIVIWNLDGFKVWRYFILAIYLGTVGWFGYKAYKNITKQD